MNKIPKDKRDKVILVGIGTGAVVAAIWFLLISDQLRSHTEARKHRDEARLLASRGQATLKSGPAIEQSLEDYTARLKQCEAEMAAPNDMYSWIIQTMSSFRTGYSVEIPQLSRGSATDVGMFSRFPYPAAVFTVRGTAYYHDLGKFLAAFENAHPYFRVQSVEIEGGSSADPNLTPAQREKLVFKMDLLTLVRPIAQ
jgi:hypothetical protein